jgi:glutamyl-tRNA reductase
MRGALRRPTLTVIGAAAASNLLPPAPDALPAFLALLRALDGVREAAALATCHRAEIYLVADDDRAAASIGGSRAGLWTLAGPAAARHLLRVACGIDSPILGDGQILGQVRRAYATARGAGTTGPWLNRLFETALCAGRRTRHLTGLGRGATTTPSAAVRLAERLTGGLAGRHVLVVGAGEAAALAARHVARRTPARLLIANRTPSRAEAVAQPIGATAMALDDLAGALAEADVVIAATARPDAVITAAVLRQAMAERPGRPLLAVDLAVPCDIEPSAASVPGVTLVGLARVERHASSDRALRAASVPAAEAIVDEGLGAWEAWQAGAAAADVFRTLRAHVDGARRRAIARAVLIDADREALDRRTRQTMNRVLHRTVVGLKALRGTPAGAARLSQWRERLGGSLPPAVPALPLSDSTVAGSG